MQGTSTVEVFESGIGAINLPLMAGMVGSKATRSCHPSFLWLMSQLLTLLAEDGLAKLARSTVSCVHYPLRETPHKQCGVCPACIFRRG